MEAISGRKTIQEIAAHHTVHPILVSQWKQQPLDDASELFTRGRKSKDKEEGPTKEAPLPSGKMTPLPQFSTHDKRGWLALSLRSRRIDPSVPGRYKQRIRCATGHPLGLQKGRYSQASAAAHLLDIDVAKLISSIFISSELLPFANALSTLG